MKEFKTSPHFVFRVMSEVRAYEATRIRELSRTQLFLSSKFARYALSGGGALLGFINLVRIYQTLFSPVLCR